MHPTYPTTTETPKDIAEISDSMPHDDRSFTVNVHVHHHRLLLSIIGTTTAFCMCSSVHHKDTTYRYWNFTGWLALKIGRIGNRRKIA